MVLIGNRILIVEILANKTWVIQSRRMIDMNKSDFRLSDLEKDFLNRYSQDVIMMMATVSKDLEPRLRVIDTFWYKDSFYTVGYAKSRKVEDIALNPIVTLQNGWNQFVGPAEFIGHPLDEKNKEIREVFIKMFSWYFPVNNENDPHTCYIKITPQKGEFDDRINRLHYSIDFVKNTYKKTWFNDHVASKIVFE